MAITGYNSSPPSDDGTEVPSNEITWSGIKTKLTDPIKTEVDLFSAAFDVSAASTQAGSVDASGNVTLDNDLTSKTVNATGDTSAGDNAAMGYTASEGLVLTGQGSVNDVTIKNDADAEVLAVRTGTTGAKFAGGVGIVSTPLGYYNLNIGGLTSDGASTLAALLNASGVLTGANGDTAGLFGTLLSASITTQSNSETITDVAQVRVDEPTITEGTDTITNAYSLLVTGAPTEATNNYAAYFSSGDVSIASGDLGIGTSSPDGTLHAHTATAGSIAANSDSDDGVFENNSNVGISLLSPDAAAQNIMFGSPTGTNDMFQIQSFYNSGTPYLRILENGTEGLRLQGNNLTILTGDLIITAPTTPASAGATGTVGTIAWDSNYVYVCVATDTWKRSALSTW